jgi:SAM-dependent methyltransferase
MEMKNKVEILKQKITTGETLLDEDFDALFSEKIRLHADRHFTSCYVAKVAVQFLSKNISANILDIGSGTGKFCQLGGLLRPEAQFTGIEYRRELVDVALELKGEFQLDNVEFIHENIINHSFQPYNGFFMFNPFLEHRNAAARMDHFQDAPEKEMEYSHYVQDQLSQCQPGARLATFYVLKNQIPSNFRVVKESMGGMLLFWVSE